MKTILLASLLLSLVGRAQDYPRVTLEFEVDGKTAEMKDQSTVAIYVIDDENGTLTMMLPAIDSGSFTLPAHMKPNHKYTIVARFNQRYLALGTHAFESLRSSKWVVGLDMRPFNQKYPIDSSLVSDTKGVVYLKLFPLDSAEGYVVMQTINNPKVFFRDSKRITCLDSRARRARAH